jgi:agmatinase
LDRDLEDYQIGDLGDLDFSGLPLPQAVDLIEVEVGALLDAHTLPFIFGGEHTIALPIARAVLKRYPDALILHFDAHADLRESYLGEQLSHAAWAYHIGQEFGFDRLLQLGIRSGLREEFRFGRAHCGHFSADLIIPHDIRARLGEHPIYITLDIDVLDASVLPGTGTPEAGGVTYRELMTCLRGLDFMRVVAMDLNEVAPPLDPTGASSAVAAKIAREMMLLFGSR